MEVGSVNTLVDPAHHGTSRESAENILATHFRPGINESSYLGKGVYFFDDNEEEAVWWAREKRRDSSGWAVLAAEVRLGRCLDLARSSHCNLVREMARQLEERGNPNVTEAVAINALVELTNTIDTIRATQPRKNAEVLLQGGHYFTGHPIVICVVDVSMISNVRMVNSEG